MNATPSSRAGSSPMPGAAEAGTRQARTLAIVAELRHEIGRDDSGLTGRTSPALAFSRRGGRGSQLLASSSANFGFEAVISTPNGGWSVAEEYRCTRCGAIGACAGADNITLADLDSLADRHECLPRVDRKDAGGAA